MLKQKKQMLLPTGSVMRKDDYLPMTKGIDHNLYDSCGFISIHKSLIDDKWALCSPLFLVQDNGTRPEFEQLRLDNFTAALMVAIEQALKHETFVVIVDDPTTGMTMQPSRDIKQV